MAYPSSTVMNWQPIGQSMGIQPINSFNATQQHPLGMIIDAQDLGTAALGCGKFIYLGGVASTAAGDAVTFDTSLGTTVRLVDDGRIGPVAVAMSANVLATTFGWYQIQGCAVVQYLTNATIDLECYLTATAGAISSDIVAGDIIINMITRTAKDLAGTKTAAGFSTCYLAHPQVNLV